MDQLTIVQNIKKKLESLSKLIEKTSDNQSFRKIDLDLIQDKIRDLYDYSFLLEDFTANEDEASKSTSNLFSPEFIDEVLERKDNTDAKVQKAIAEMKEKDAKKDEEDRKEEIPAPAKKSKVVVVKKKSDQVTERVELDPEKIEPDLEDHKKKVAEEKDDAEFSENIVHREFSHDETKTVADTFQGDPKPSLNEILGDKSRARDLASQYSDRPITNLKASISINDKIWFIKELFNGDTDLYNDTLKQINDMNNLDEALMYLNTNFDWDQEKESFQSFLELLFRRFLPDEIEST